MKVLDRDFKPTEFFPKLKEIVQMFLKSLIFKEFVSLWIAYIKRNNPKSNKFSTRDGLKIMLSNNLHDSITVMVIFCRQEYGKIKPGSVVIDVGANIGIFSLYAARSGAKRIYAFEPNRESFEVLVQNIKANDLENIIIPFNVAVGSNDGEKVLIPKYSSPYNKTVSNTINEDNYDVVETISLPTFIDKRNISKIDFLKMDCEGAEYPIIYSMTSTNFRIIKTFRLESHFSHEKENLIKFFYKHGFRKTFEKHLIIWFER